MTGQDAGKGFLRFLVRVVYLVLLGGTGGILAGVLGFNEGISPFILIGIMITYWTTVGKIFKKLGIAKPAPPVTAEPTK